MRTLRGLGRLLLKDAPRVARNAFLAWRGKSSIHWTCDIARGAEVTDSTLDSMAAVALNGSVRRSKIGRYSSIGRYSKVADAQIGSFCSIAWDATIGAYGHPIQAISSHRFPYLPAFCLGSANANVPSWRERATGVSIGHDVWVGANTVIVDGVRIGHGSIIGAGAVVTKDVPPYMIVGGVPARVIRPRFPEALREALEALSWWSLPERILQENGKLFREPVSEATLERLKEVVREVRGVSLEARQTQKR